MTFRYNLHKAEEIGIDDFQAQRSPDGRYRITPLRALWETRKIHKRAGTITTGASLRCATWSTITTGTSARS